MEYSFFKQQLESAREHFAVEPAVMVFDGRIHVPLDEVKYSFYHDGNRIILHFGADPTDWKAKYEEANEEWKWAEKEIKILGVTIREREDDLDEAAGEIENLKMEIATLESEKSDLESDIESLKEKIKELEKQPNPWNVTT